MIIGQNGILSTPAVSTIIRKYKTLGGIVLTASHNPGGPNADFGIKFNCENGGPAPDKVTNKIYDITKSLKVYKIASDINVDIEKIQSNDIKVDGRTFVVDIIDPVEDYLILIKKIFDFDCIKTLLQGSAERPKFQILIDSLNGGNELSFVLFFYFINAVLNNIFELHNDLNNLITHFYDDNKQQKTRALINHFIFRMIQHCIHIQVA